ncbi:MAG TPA: DUF721 domain-containing protein [Rhizomicrobium sp.]|jgi:hypothetical protein
MARTPPPKQSDKTPAAAPVRRGRANMVGSDIRIAGGAAFARAGFTDPTLILRWAEIAGPEIARIARPLKFTEGASGGTLTLLAEPAAALFLGHDARTLCARINGYLGRDVVARVKFVQGALTVPKPAPRPAAPGAAAAPNDPVHNYNGPEALKNALQSLARWRRPPQER